MRERSVTGLRSKLFAMRVVKGWSELIGEAVGAGIMREFKGSLGNTWLSVIGEDNLQDDKLKGKAG